MRAARCEQYGGPESVVVRRIPSPEVTPGHVLVDVAAAAVNFPDLLFIANTYQVPAPLPFTRGGEFSGRARPPLRRSELRFGAASNVSQKLAGPSGQGVQRMAVKFRAGQQLVSAVDGTQIGKRYVDGADTIQLLCTKAGQGTLSFDGNPLQIQAANPLPASD